MKKNMSKMASRVLAVTLAISVARAESVPTPTGTLGLPVIAVRNPGRYEELQQNQTEIIKDVLSQVDRANQEYIRSQVAEVDAAFTQFVQQNVIRGIRKLSEDSVRSPVELNDYFKAVRAYDEGLALLQMKIANFSFWKKPESAATIGDIKFNFSGAVKADLDAIAKNYQVLLQAQIAMVESLTVRITHPQLGAGGFITQRVHAALDDRLTVFTSDQINELRRAGTVQLEMTPLIRARASVINAFTQSFVVAAIATYGKSQIRRIEVDDDGLKDTLRTLQEIFFARDLLRFQYGVPIGSIGINYMKRQINWDFASLNNDLQFLPTGMYLYGTDVRTSARNLLANALKQQALRSRSVFGAETEPLVRRLGQYGNFFDPITILNWKAGNVAQRTASGAMESTNSALQGFAEAFNSVPSRILTAINMMRGQMAWSAMNEIVLRYLVNDIENDLMVDRPNGLVQLRHKFQLRYARTPGEKAYFAAITRDMRAQTQGATSAQRNAYSSVVRANSGSLLGVISATSQALSMYRAQRNDGYAKLELADQLEAKNARTKDRQFEDQRINDLFGDFSR